MKNEANVHDRFDRIENRFQDVLDAIHVFSTAVDKRFDKLASDVSVLKSDVAILKADVGILNHKLDRVDVRVNRLEAV